MEGRDDPDLPADFGKIDGEDHPDSVIANAAAAVERERCARIAESFSRDYGPEIGKMAKRIAEVIRRQPRVLGVDQ